MTGREKTLVVVRLISRLCDNCGVVDPMFNYSPGKFKP